MRRFFRKNKHTGLSVLLMRVFSDRVMLFVSASNIRVKLSCVLKYMNLNLLVCELFYLLLCRIFFQGYLFLRCTATLFTCKSLFVSLIQNRKNSKYQLQLHYLVFCFLIQRGNIQRLRQISANTFVANLRNIIIGLFRYRFICFNASSTLENTFDNCKKILDHCKITGYRFGKEKV